MSDDSYSTRLSVCSLAVAFVATALASFLGMNWNMLEPRWAFPFGTKVMLLAAIVMSGLARCIGRTRPGATILIVGIAVPLGAFTSMALHMLEDPTSQNLWPVSLVALAVIGPAASLCSTLIGSLALRLTNAMVR